MSSSPSIARIVPELHLNRAFDYSVPQELRSQIEIGSRVQVPFRSRQLSGIVIALPEKAEVKNLKPITKLMDKDEFIPSSLVRLALWMSQYYCASLGLCFQCILPSSVRRKVGHRLRQWLQPISMEEQRVSSLLKNSKKQKEAWHHLAQSGGEWITDLSEQTGISRAVWKALVDKGLASVSAEPKDRNPLSLLKADPKESNKPLTLNEEQQHALEKILAEEKKDTPRPILLHGVTGSGKTEVYLQAIAHILKKGKSALMLVPEIVLTPQAVQRFHNRFLGEKVRIAVLHSGLSEGEHFDQWKQIQSGSARVVIGARSAVFAPIKNLGLIVVDEEHEGSYKQEESPHYHGRDLAIVRAHDEGIPIVLGSATPSLESFYNSKKKKYDIICLTKRVDSQKMPTMHVVDMRLKEKKKAKEQGKIASPLSPLLAEAIEKRIDQGEQTIIFLNRRGYSTSLQCPDCGHIEECPSCSVSLTYHRKGQQLRCHFCDHTAPPPSRCPECNFDAYSYSGTGTQKIEDIIEKQFSKGRLMRMDSDSMRGKNKVWKALEQFGKGDIDILIGTQMIGKGLHFPHVSCVGIIHADMALQIPDFRAAERVFQHLTQVSGRAGRSARGGEVFIQTYTPFHPAIQFARHHDYDGFAEEELEFRQSLNYPPFSHGVLITWRGRDLDKTAFVAENTTKRLKEILPAEVKISGPSEAPIAKINNFYRYHLFLRTQKIQALGRSIRPLFIDRTLPDGVRCSVDVDPYSLL